MVKSRLIKYTLALIFFGLVALLNSGQIPSAQQKGDDLEVAFLDVGQGDSILITTPHRHHILIDGGPDGSVLTRIGQQMRFTDHAIDLVVATHNHADHISGLNRVLERYDVQKMWISGAIHTTNEYLKMLENIKEQKIPTEVVWQGKETEIDGVKLKVLYPPFDQTGARPQDQHDSTIVLRLTFGQTNFLLTGDINEEHEQQIITNNVDLKADVLKVPHHGSASGLALNFLSAVNPTYAVIQVGANNRYGHPAESILTKLRERNIQIMRNDELGTIIFYADGTNKLEHINR